MKNSKIYFYFKKVKNNSISIKLRFRDKWKKKFKINIKKKIIFKELFQTSKLKIQIFSTCDHKKMLVLVSFFSEKIAVSENMKKSFSQN